MTDAAKSNPAEPEDKQRRHRVRSVLDNFLARRAAGEQVSTAKLLETHPDLLPELAEEFQKVELIDRARMQMHGARQTPAGGHDATQETTRFVCCPHCQSRAEVDGEASLSEIRCSACGQYFNVVAEQAAVKSPVRVGRFELIEQLGVGSFGTVWMARDTKLDREVAIKIPRQRALGPLEIEELMREARAAAQLHHPNIVAVHEVGRDDETVYIVSDLVRGLPLDRWVESRPPGFQSSAELCCRVAQALGHAHEAGVIHRDLKPANIMMDEQGEPHLTDFGLAKRTADEITMTLDGHILGTPAYMSPEQARGEAAICDARSDVYSLGVVLFELLTRELPFRGNMSVLAQKVIHDDPPSPRHFNRHVPRDLETICLKCLEKAPQQRYQSAREVADDFQNWFDGMPINARPVGRAEHLWRLCRRHPMAAGFASSLLVVLLLMSAVLLVLFPNWEERLSDNMRDIQTQSEFVLPGLKVDVVKAAEDASKTEGLAHELTNQNRGNDVMQRFVEYMHYGTEKKYGTIEVINWFLLDNKGRIWASSDPTAGKGVIGEDFSKRTYFNEAREGTAMVTTPYLSENDRLYKLPISSKVLRDGEMIGVIVVSVSTPGTRALDNQRRFIRDLYIGAGVSLAPLVLFLFAAALSRLWPRLRRPVAAVRA